MIVTEDDLKKALMDSTLIEELDEHGYEPTPLRPEGFGITAEEYANKKNCTIWEARKILKKAVMDGALSSRVMLSQGKSKHPFVYYRIGEWPPKEKKGD